ncbi:MAG: hypothetical protein U5N26_02830 [Candidatus Marinimicrobia bacterium]|nr:hypothetical protein [Candidatus Neomarinimicrobiota bacterium]
MRVRPQAPYLGVSTIMVIATDDGVGELSDTADFDLTVTPNTQVADIPETFRVYPNYPNPFNPVTTLHFDLPASEQVKIEIFNIRGQRAAGADGPLFRGGIVQAEIRRRLSELGCVFSTRSVQVSTCMLTG